MMQRHQKTVFSICFRMTGDYFCAEDLAQETFISAYKAIDRFDGKNEKAWLSKIAANKCLDYLKSGASRISPAEDCVLESLSPGSDFESEYFKSTLLSEIEKACNDLSEPYRSAALSYYIGGLTSAQIAMESGEPVKTISTRIYRARQMLKNKLREVI